MQTTGKPLRLSPGPATGDHPPTRDQNAGPKDRKHLSDVVSETRASVRVFHGLTSSPAAFSHGDRAEFRAFTDGLSRLADGRGAVGRSADIGGAPASRAFSGGNLRKG